jgi:signal transduction histidine kinase
MNLRWYSLKQLRGLLTAASPDLRQQIARLRYTERNVGLPVKAAVILLLFYYLFFSTWLTDVPMAGDQALDIPPREGQWDIIRRFFLFYVVANAGAASMLLGMRHLPFTLIERVVFNIAWVDALFLAALSVATGGFDSILYWAFLGLIVRNAVSNAVASRQITLNLIVTFCYFLAGIVDVVTAHWEAQMFDDVTLLAIEQGPQYGATEPFLLRLTLLLLLTICCFGVQVLFDKQRQEAETREYIQRQEQLQVTGRLAAEIAHQLKNPLGIINNAAFSLQRTVKEGKKTITQQIQIIREEVDRSDRIITELMGYARLSEGKVERLDINDELEKALEQVFPPGARYDIHVHRDYASALPPLLIQRSHLSEIFVNILQNAREAMEGVGSVMLTTRYGENYSVIVVIADDGPGIPPGKLHKIFEPYFTTKEKGTGLGLAIVKHNTEIYGGTVDVESELGQGTRFTLNLPARALIRLRR